MELSLVASLAFLFWALSSQTEALPAAEIAFPEILGEISLIPTLGFGTYVAGQLQNIVCQQPEFRENVPVCQATLTLHAPMNTPTLPTLPSLSPNEISQAISQAQIPNVSNGIQGLPIANLPNEIQNSLQIPTANLPQIPNPVLNMGGNNIPLVGSIGNSNPFPQIPILQARQAASTQQQQPTWYHCPNITQTFNSTSWMNSASVPILTIPNIEVVNGTASFAQGPFQFGNAFTNLHPMFPALQPNLPAVLTQQPIFNAITNATNAITNATSTFQPPNQMNLLACGQTTVVEN